METRPNKHQYYFDIAKSVASRSTCLRRKFGAIIVKNDTIISTGYNGAPRGRKNCCDIDYCIREQRNIPRGTHYELCRSVHAEPNALIAAGKEANGAVMYIVGVECSTGEVMLDASCCAMCKRLVINAGITSVYFLRDNKDGYEEINIRDWIYNDDSLTDENGY